MITDWKVIGIICWSLTTIVALWRLIVNAKHTIKVNRLDPELGSKNSTLCVYFRFLFASSVPYSDIDSFRIRQQNLWFHVFSFAGSALEVPKYIAYIMLGDDDEYNMSMYPMHLISLFCIYISFCIIINLWGSAIVFEAKDSKRAITLRTVLVILTSIDFILVTMVSVQCYTLSDLDDVLEGPWYKRMTTYQSIGMSMLSMFFLIFGYAAQRKIWRTFTRSEGWKRDDSFWKGLIRLNIIIVICFVCFTLKAFLLYLIQLPENSSTDLDENPLHLPTTTWYFLYEWLPDILPRLALLYLMSRNLSDEDGPRTDMSTSGEGEGGGHGLSSSETFSEDPVFFMGRSFTTDSVDFMVNGEQQRMVAEKMKKAISDDKPRELKLSNDRNTSEANNNDDNLKAPLLGVQSI